MPHVVRSRISDRLPTGLKYRSINAFHVVGALALLAAFILTLVPFSTASAQAGLPNYQVQYLGSGSPAAINNSGVVVGATTDGTNYAPWVSIAGAPSVPLPVPAGAQSVFPTDVNDAGVIVGVAYTNWNPVAVRWMPNAGGYAIEELPRLPGEASSYATAINNLGQIVGSRSALGYVPNSYGWLYSETGGMVNLATTYGLWTVPTDINDVGQVISGVERLNLNTGVIQNTGAGPSNYQAISSVAINNNGQMVGQAPQTSISLNIVSVFRYSGGSWSFIAGTSRYTVATSINNLGDVGYGELGAGLYLDGLGTYALGGLLDPAAVSAGWAINGNGLEINDGRQVTTRATNSITGQSGAVLLTPSGTLPPPTAPVNLQAVAHPATSQEPFNAINLTWENTSVLTRSYELQRSPAGANNWTTLALTPPGTMTHHTDTTVGVGITYDYRVRAVGLGGPSPWSTLATATSPSTPLDTTPPVVNFVTPANGATVSGTVAVSATASDNVAVKYLEISYWNQFTGQEVILGSVNDAGSLTVNWNTTGLTPATYAVWAFAHDALGNWTQTEISVNVSGSAGKSMKVSDIVLKGTVKGSKVTVTGDVYIKDASSGAAVAGATVTGQWTLPNGSTTTRTAVTNTAGRARFTTSGGRGTYTLTITGAAKSGYTFDSAGSVLVKSITK
jgi:hypothetical protein